MIEYLPFIAALLAVGAGAGLIAGMFGIGGGVVMVPAMYFVLTALGYGDTAMHAAVGTSLMVIVATSLRSVAAHAKRGAVDFQLVRTWSPWIVLGTLAGAALADIVPGRVLTALFGGVALLLSAQFFFGRPDWRLAEDMPGLPLRAVLAGAIGVLSALMGIGGGVFGVTLMSVCGRSMHTAVATSAGFGVAIGLPGAIGYMIAGMDEAGRAPFSLGYVNMAGFVCLAAAAVFLAPVGAALAHRLNAARLKQAFAICLLIVAVNMLREAVFGG
ncbi:sulfite exporter TauE/SafE family protein [Maricaulaceae bacterium MS644]